MAHEVLPLPFKPHLLDGLSDRLLVSHYENNYGGAVRRLNAIEGRLAGGDLPRDKPVVAYCIYGFQVSGEATAELRRRGLDARALAGGIAAWHAMGGPTVPLTPQQKGGHVR